MKVQPQPVFDINIVNDSRLTEIVAPESVGSAVLRAQILLDRANFSPGEIDGRYGDNTRIAIQGLQGWRKLEPTGTVDEQTWQLLNSDQAPALVPYLIAPEDVAGPFQRTPPDMMEKAKLASLAYGSPAEALGEKFHISPRLLGELNPGKDLSRAGEEIIVPNVLREPVFIHAERVVVSKTRKIVEALAADGTLMAQFPATIGSEHDPLPIGEWKVTIVKPNPIFNYNPALFWDADPGHAKARIAPGPNNPVGTVWIGLSKPHYGIHGSPEPGKIGHTESHGCIRLTNWDANKLAAMIQTETPVILQEP